MNSSDDIDLLEELADEYTARQRRGERPRLEEYAERFPHLASEIREVFPALAMMGQVVPAANDLAITGDAEPPARAPVLERLGEYRILRQIGSGGMGVVYEAEQEPLQRRVALKVLGSGLSASERSRERFQREARAAARMHHTNIVPVFDVGQDNNIVYYTMQLINGEGLDEVINELQRMKNENSAGAGQPVAAAGDEAARSVAVSLLSGEFTRGSFAAHATDPGTDSNDPSHENGAREPELSTDDTVAQRAESAVTVALPGRDGTSPAETTCSHFHVSVARIGLQVAEALAYAHSRGIVHRDIKPSNLLLDADGVVWITDFGLAKTDEDALTHTGDILGTLRYMSPERFGGQCDARADVYSLGLTLYELLTLRPAFESTDHLRLMELVRENNPAPPRRIAPQVPRDLETIIVKSIDKNPKQRYQSADELAEDLRRFLNDEPVKARRISGPERLLRWSRRNKGLAASLAMAALFMVLATTVSVIATAYFRNAEFEARGVAYNRTISAVARALENGDIFGAASLLSPLESMHERHRFPYYYVRNKCRQILQGIRLRYNAPVFVTEASPNGKFLACYVGKEELLIWDRTRTVTAENAHRLPTEPATSGIFIDHFIAFSPGGNLLACGASGRIHLWDLTSGVEVALSNGPTVLESERDETAESAEKRAFSLAFARDDLLVSGDEMGRVELWNIARDEPPSSTAVIIGDGKTEDAIGSMDVSPTGELLAVGTTRGRVHLLDLTNTGIESPTNRTHFDAGPGSAWVVAFSPDGSQLATGGADSLIRIWETENGVKLTNTLEGHAATVLAMEYSPDGRLLTGSVDRSIRLWDPVIGRLIGELTVHEDTVTSVTFDTNGGRILSSSQDGCVGFWDSATVMQDHLHTNRTSWARWLAFSPDGGHLGIGYQNQTIEVVDIHGSSNKNVDKKNGYLGAFGRDGLLVVTADADSGSIAFGPVAEPNRQITQKAGSVVAMDVSPDGRLVAVADDSGTVTIYDKDSETPIVFNTPVGSKVTNLNLTTADIGRLAILDSTNRIIVWDIKRKERTFEFALGGPTGGYTSPGYTSPRYPSPLEFSPDGDTIAVAVMTDLALLDLDKGQRQILRGHALGITSLAFSPTENLLASAGRDRKIILWDTETGDQSFTIYGHGAWITALAFSPDGQTLASAGGFDWSIRLWRAPRDKH